MGAQVSDLFLRCIPETDAKYSESFTPPKVSGVPWFLGFDIFFATHRFFSQRTVRWQNFKTLRSLDSLISCKVILHLANRNNSKILNSAKRIRNLLLNSPSLGLFLLCRFERNGFSFFLCVCVFFFGPSHESIYIWFQGCFVFFKMGPINAFYIGWKRPISRGHLQWYFTPFITGSGPSCWNYCIFFQM